MSKKSLILFLLTALDICLGKYIYNSKGGGMTEDGIRMMSTYTDLSNQAQGRRWVGKLVLFTK